MEEELHLCWWYQCPGAAVTSSVAIGTMVACDSCLSEREHSYIREAGLWYVELLCELNAFILGNALLAWEILSVTFSPFLRKKLKVRVWVLSLLIIFKKV